MGALRDNGVCLLVYYLFVCSPVYCVMQISSRKCERSVKQFTSFCSYMYVASKIRSHMRCAALRDNQ